MALTRLDHWHTRAFHGFLRERCFEPFVWGKNDCALFAADGVHAITGTDIAAPFRGAYSSEAGAMAAIARITGGKTLSDAVAWCAAQHAMPERKHPLMAQRGDLAIVEDAGQLKAALVHLSGAHLVVPGDRGLHYLPITSVQRAWAYS